MLKELPKQEVTLTEVEQKIIEKRLSGISFCQLSGDSLKQSIDLLILKASAIIGCALPQTEFFADILTTEIIEFVNEMGYGELTIDEIIFALRINSKGGLRYPSGIDVEVIPFWGSHFNLDFLSKVLGNYKTFRGILDRKLQNYLDGHK